MAAAQRGDAASYRQLLQEVAVWLRGYYARRLPPSAIQDATQDGLLAIHARRETYDPGRPFKAWLHAIARYKWIDRLRALSRDPTSSWSDEEAEDRPTSDHESSVTSAVLLGQLLARLKPAQASVIRLVKVEGLSIEEASDRTGQSASLVKVNIHRGLAKLSAMV